MARSLLGPGLHWVVTSDRYSAYQWLALQRRQLCWADLRRDFQAMIDRNDSGSSIGQELLEFSDDVFHWWYRVRDGTLRRSSLRTYIAEQRPWLRTLLEKGSVCGCERQRGVPGVAEAGALWTFLRVEGVGPTNNAAERALRHAVLWRKSSYGTASAKGSRYVADILSVVATCRQQGRNVLEFVTARCQRVSKVRLPHHCFLRQPNGAATACSGCEETAPAKWKVSPTCPRPRSNGPP